MGLFNVTGIKTEENKEIFAFAEKVLNLDKRISVHVSGGYILGTFRGKRDNEYEYCYASKSFELNSDAYEVEDAFTQAEQDEKVEVETIEPIEEITEENNTTMNGFVFYQNEDTAAEQVVHFLRVNDIEVEEWHHDFIVIDGIPDIHVDEDELLLSCKGTYYEGVKWEVCGATKEQSDFLRDLLSTSKLFTLKA